MGSVKETFLWTTHLSILTGSFEVLWEMNWEQNEMEEREK